MRLLISVIFLFFSAFAMAAKVSPLYHFALGDVSTPSQGCSKIYPEESGSFVRDDQANRNIYCTFPTKCGDKVNGCPFAYGYACLLGSNLTADNMCDDGKPEPPKSQCDKKRKGIETPGNNSTQVIDSKTRLDMPSLLGKNACDKDGCSFRIDALREGQFEDGSSWTYQVQQYSYTGDSCTAQDQPTKQPPPTEPCPAGTAPGDINGKQMCLPSSDKGSANTDKKEETTKDKDGKETKRTIVTLDTYDPSTGEVTRKTTTTNGDGSTEEKTEKQPLPNFCAQNPKAAICKEEANKNANLDSCTSPPVCEGDAIQCAIAKQVYLQRCKQEKDEIELKNNPLTKLGDQLANGNDPLGSKLPTPENGKIIDLNKALNQNSFLPSQCLQDIKFSFKGNDFSIPVSMICEHILPVRSILLFCAFFIALRIIFRGEH